MLGLSYWTLVSWRRKGNRNQHGLLPSFKAKEGILYTLKDVQAFRARAEREIVEARSRAGLALAA